MTFDPIIIPDTVKSLMIQHQGLGDAIVCNGLTRWAIDQDRFPKPMGLFVRQCSFESIKFMYRDLDESELVLICLPPYPYGYDDFGLEFQAAKDWVNRTGNQLVNMTMFEEHWHDYRGPIFDENFYRWFGLSVDLKYSRWRCDRDRSIEIPGNPDWIFLHEDPSRNYNINRDFIPVPEGKKIVEPKDFNVPNIWQLWDVIEKACQVHVINSSFMNAIEFMEPQGQLFWHRLYARNEVSYPTTRKPWQIIE